MTSIAGKLSQLSGIQIWVSNIHVACQTLHHSGMKLGNTRQGTTVSFILQEAVLYLCMKAQNGSTHFAHSLEAAPASQG